MKKLSEMTLEEKVDMLVAEQLKLKKYARLKAIISVITFTIVIVVPILAVIWAGRYIQNVIGLTGQEIGEVFRTIKGVTDSAGNGIVNLFN